MCPNHRFGRVDVGSYVNSVVILVRGKKKVCKQAALLEKKTKYLCGATASTNGLGAGYVARTIGVCVQQDSDFPVASHGVVAIRVASVGK